MGDIGIVLLPNIDINDILPSFVILLSVVEAGTGVIDDAGAGVIGEVDFVAVGVAPKMLRCELLHSNSTTL